MKNSMEVKFKAIRENESFARSVVSSFILPLNPNLNELSDIKTAVSEAVTNVIVHAYPNKIGYVIMKVTTYANVVEIIVSDEGVGIENIEKARMPFFTTKPNDERSGMGFTVMESFMDKLEVTNTSKGLEVVMSKTLELNDVARINA